MNRPMLPTLSEKIPEGSKWVYEIKYDGFRAFLIGTEDDLQLISRNGKNLSEQFPEIIDDFKRQRPPIKDFILDGEIVILNNPYQGNFDLLQTRGRLKNKEKIKEHSSTRPVTFMAFDLIKHEKETTGDSYLARRKKLKEFIKRMNLSRIKVVEAFQDWNTAHKIVFDYLGEGIVAKRKSSLYTYSKRSKEWLKIKLWRTISGFLTEYNPENDYFTAEVYNEEQRSKLGHVKHGLDDEQFKTLRTFFKEKGQNWRIDSGVCVDIDCLQAQNGELREPMFKDFRFDLEASDCTVKKLQWSLSLFPDEVEFTNTNKQLWPNGLRKEDYLVYLRHISPYMLPFFSNKKVTVIRYPDGIAQTSFFQKHKPDYAPDYITGWSEEDGEISLRADQLSPLLWLGNQGALEFHLPFQKALSSVPDEIIFDLDPPSREEFQSAVLAAQLLKHLLDKLEVYSFVKTSGNKGLQIHIPIVEGEMNYDETRQFTERLARLLVKEKPDLFTVERLKKKRGHRLYIDYVQHAEGKTIIAPYSARATKEASVATPLYWKELTESLTPYSFTITNVINRVQTLGCPFQTYDEVRPLQPIQTMKKL
ncbi:bifunctional non-homologous end joining protein LigD [Halobacillus andaensis]|uniref:Bifunctional non-homologous end joining protein LigD n=1 Tax=Halobacillus andaensis TaxID=1176239 RepID=A0A917B3R3_HALAA|nr:DNA ligase D [Halobacillus andaensis]MBP2004680.1 bifunctional non-homologous end joining protein LigD [Halobacillus andaensis]GGF19786.1 bifunctional non-homologous end joining protein LigD [Halobacillus andaensis]